MERLNKVLAARGIASRRKADALIQAGSVSVNGVIVTDLGTKVAPDDQITVGGKVVAAVKLVTYALYKPRGVVTTLSAQDNSKIVTDYLPATPGLHPVGRLDKDSEGLLLLTNDGALTQRLTHPSFEHEKEYTVTCKSSEHPNSNSIIEKLMKGVKLGDGLAMADKVTIRDQKHGILELVITVHEGRHHLIRRMCAAVNLDVTRLIRTRISNLTLGSLQSGEWRQLTADDLRKLA